MSAPLGVRRLHAVLALICGVLLVAACSGSPSGSTPVSDNPEDADSILAEYGLAGLEPAELIDRLDATPVADRPDGLMASVRPDQLVIRDAEGTQAALPLPADQFYLSVAPYQGSTHDCFFHSLTTCRGELRNADIHVTVTNTDTGEVIIDQAMRTFDNGFAGMWLPAGIQAELTISHEGRVHTSQISTGADDATCITTAKLA
ncbi:CueP family metal-binding protein [Parenemella sanctibonifatiensis]|uniref:CueP family metal-binding protein n=1 Tax=Parenemella sanctibonifatiensis TaxID=2016505 RepID=A0A255EJR0_9ACTN|nr:CueP family metal-binding protein [Parenemella sanctibonifatiensis]OYN91211.1 hypothetical protein CGZ91_07085 [Parenemella sanctibonifatiensis]